MIINRVQGGKSTLLSTTDGLVADGNLGQFFSTHEEVGFDALISIRNDHGGDGDDFASLSSSSRGRLC